MGKLQLALKTEYFDAIKAGTKTEEYRLYTPYWTKRLYTYDPFGPTPAVFDSIILTRGYPKRGDPERTLERAWKGFTTRSITHPHFGPDAVSVYVLDVSTPLHPRVEVGDKTLKEAAEQALGALKALGAGDGYAAAALRAALSNTRTKVESP